jgi:hypothetical protein
VVCSGRCDVAVSDGRQRRAASHIGFGRCDRNRATCTGRHAAGCHPVGGRAGECKTVQGAVVISTCRVGQGGYAAVVFIGEALVEVAVGHEIGLGTGHFAVAQLADFLT